MDAATQPRAPGGSTATLVAGAWRSWRPKDLHLAIGIRLMLVAAFIALSPWVEQGDIWFYYQLGQQSDLGHYPYLTYWMEYPPVFPWLAVGLYRLLAAIQLGGAVPFYWAFAGLMSSVELANVVLVHRLARHAHGERAAGRAALIYAACPTPIWFSLAWFDALAVLAMLAAMLALLSRRASTAGVLIALGVLTKVFPAVLVLVAPAVLGRRHTVRLALAAGAALALCVGPLAAVRPDLFAASVASLLTRPAWETLPALLAGDYMWGKVAPLSERFMPQTAFMTSSGASPLVSLVAQAPLLLALWAAWQLARSRQVHPRALSAAAALGVATLLLGGKGFSPQFLVWLLPLIVVVWPDRTGVIYVTLGSIWELVFYQFLFPVMFAYFRLDTGSLDAVAAAAWIATGSRTVLLAAVTCHLCVKIQRACQSEPRPGRSALRPVSPRLLRGRVFLY